VSFAFAPIDDGARVFRECALERVFGWRRFARAGQPRTDCRALERSERDAAPHLASVGQSDDDAGALELAVRQAEHAADGLE
jgi:hypothetical protein